MKFLLRVPLTDGIFIRTTTAIDKDHALYKFLERYYEKLKDYDKAQISKHISLISEDVE